MENKRQQKSEAMKSLLHQLEFSKSGASEAIDEDLVSRYHQFFTEKNIEEYESDISNRCLSTIFEQQGIKYDPLSTPQTDIDLSLINESVNSEVVVVEARWGHFTMQLHILNVLKESLIHHRKHTLGSYGRIYHAEILSNSFVIKCINFSRQKSSRQAVYMAVKEYILLKIASALQIGPMVKEIIGFDLIIHQNCIEFAIQRCEQIDAISQEGVADLKENLYLMHKLGIVHFDIKPSNIMFSQHFRKYVFIDFGLSEIMNVKKGQKIQIFFRGTLDFSSSEMVQSFKQNQAKFIDIYYNDVYALQKTFRSYGPSVNSFLQYDPFQESIEFLQQNSAITSKSIDLLLLIYFTKFKLYSSNQRELAFIFKSRIVEQNESYFQEEILDFFYQLSPTEQLRSIYQTYIISNKKQGMKFRKIKEFFELKSLYLIVMKSDVEKKNAMQKVSSILWSLMAQRFIRKTKMFIILTIQNKQSQQPQNVSHIFALYMEFINFSNNLHDANMNQRVQITRKLYENGYLNYKKQLRSCQDQLLYISMAIDDIFDKLMAEISLCSTIPRFMLDLIYDVIEHMFILNHLNSHQLMKRINLAYSIHNSTQKYEDKLQFIMKINHFNYWLLYRLNTYKSKQSHFYKLRLVKFWLFQKTKQISMQQHAFGWVCNHMINIWTSLYRGQLTPAEEKMILKLPKHLYFQFNIQLKMAVFAWSTTDQLHLRINQIYKLINDRCRKKIYCFVFLFCEQMFVKLGAIQKGRHFQSMIQQNLKSLELVNSISVMYVQNLIISQSYKLLIETFWFYIDHLCSLGVSLHHKLLVLGLYQIEKRNRSIQQQFLVTRIMKKVKKISIRNISDCFRSEETSFGHVCITYEDSFDLIQIKKYYYSYFKIMYRWDEDLKKIRQNLMSITCQNCHFTALNICEIQQQQFILQEYSRNPSKYLRQNFYQRHNRMISLNNGQRKYYQFSVSFRFIMVLFCSFSRQLEAQFHGILSLYYFLKENNEIVHYLNKDETNYCILCLTFEVLREYSNSEELACFMNSLAQYITDNFASNYFLMLSNSFAKFLREFNQKIDFKGLIRQLEANRTKYSNKKIANPFNAIYYYYFLMCVPEKEKLCRRRIIQSLVYLPSDVRFYIEGHYYRHLLSTFNSQQQKSISYLFCRRKYDYLMKKTVKLFLMLDTPSTKIQLHRKNNLNLKIKRMEKKAIQLGGSFNLLQTGLNEVFVRVRRQ